MRCASNSRRASRFARALAVAFALGSPAARADVVQPNSQVIPVIPQRLSTYLNGSAENDNINEGIDVIKDAAVEPQTFAPLCSFTGKYIAKGGGANFAIGWYNVDPLRPSNMPPRYVPVDKGANLNTAAPNSDIQILFPFSAALPPANMRDLNSASIRMHAAYKGGLIGLVLIPNPNGTGNGNATQYHYTEHRFNVECTKCANPGPWYSILTYRSKMLPNTFYLGFEDLDFTDAAGNQGVNGNDLDYEDFLFRFTGLACPGAGVPCEVLGGVGACRHGITDCDMDGKLVCKPQVAPGMEKDICDGVDNDCDGTIDNGAMCPPLMICDRGRCVEPCGPGEFQCEVPLVCDRNVCIDPPCVGKTCPDGQVCHDGKCRGACEGVVCPHGQVCRADRCVEPCANVMCPMNQVCVDGVCVTGCQCRSCPGGQSCAMSGQCVDPACAMMNCPPGTYCAGGSCVDVCMGAVCPPGEECKMGRCVLKPPPPDMATPVDLAAGTPAGPEDMARQKVGPNDMAYATGSCGCEVAGRRGRDGTPPVIAWMAVAVGIALRRGRARGLPSTPSL